MIFWIIGLAGAGKTTIAKALFERLKKDRPETVLLDGDSIREIMGGDLGYTLEDRRRNGWRICRLCKYLDDQQINVVCATLSQFHEQQNWNRENLSKYIEVYLDVDKNILIERDQKGLYSGAISGKIKNVVGIDMPFQPPLAADLKLDNSKTTNDFSCFVAAILEEASRKYQISLI